MTARSPAPDSIPSRGNPLPELRQAIVALTRAPEAECMARLFGDARMAPEALARVCARARQLAEGVRAGRVRAGGVDALMHEFALGSAEGVALMCLAEALLRVPDAAGRDALIRDKLHARDWSAHVGHSPSLFVNAAAWSLALTGRLLSADESARLPGTLARMATRGGEAVVREAMEFAMRRVGRQFVMGETIEEALERVASGAAADYRYSFDMLGEAALTADDATRYAAAYAHAIHAIGGADHWRGVRAGNGISIKLSALHPRYTWSQRDRVMAELLPRVHHLCVLARGHDIGLTIDAEESDRLELSLDLFAALATDPDLRDWAGLGMVVQAYQKRAPAVIDWLIALGRRSGRRIMTRLVKGAYWDGEIKRAQQDGLADYPVYTRKVHTDTAYLACARRMLAAPDAIYPAFATHNAHTVAAVLEMAGPFHDGAYEFQCLHGMGETLYRQLVAGADPALRRPVRVYAPVGSHETLLAYLVRRLLENGANTSFVHRVVDDSVPLDMLVADPVERAVAQGGAPHPAIPLPGALFVERANSRGFDLAAAPVRRAFLAALEKSRASTFTAVPRVVGEAAAGDPSPSIQIRNPARRSDFVGTAACADAWQIEAALAAAAGAAAGWAATPAALRALCLERAAQALEARSHALVALLVREAGKTFAAGLGEVREAVDFCRYYAARLRAGDLTGSAPLGPVVAISPWNFPLAIFCGQIVAALAAGNPVIAKPAEQTPLIADQAVALLHEAGIPRGVLQCLPGPGATVGAALVADARVAAVMFTGSTEVATAIHRVLADRGDVPLIAETGGLNAMIVDSTALPEQVVTDVIASAFDSAGQRCSALRLLCLQDEIAPRVLELLDGALGELRIGPPEDFATDIGPVIDAAAHLQLDAYVDALRADGHCVMTRSLPDVCTDGHFVMPTVIELRTPTELQREVFGPVLHVVRFALHDLDALLDALGRSGYGLTRGIQSRVDSTVERILGHGGVGNVYVNRNMIGAVVGVQAFGGEGLSGTGPKAGGPLLLRRLVRRAPGLSLPGQCAPADLDTLDAWLTAGAGGVVDDAARARLRVRVAACRAATLWGAVLDLPGPTGERNTWSVHPRGVVLGLAEAVEDAVHQLAAALATGNRLAVPAAAAGWLSALPEALRGCVALRPSDGFEPWQAALLAGAEGRVAAWRRQLAAQPGPLRPILVADPDYVLERLLVERCVTVNTAATGGNAGLMGLGES